MIGKHAVINALWTLGILGSLAVTDSAKVKRVKAGRIHNQHDPVHVVVNKVG
jgi:hypothetical protein